MKTNPPIYRAMLTMASLLLAATTTLANTIGSGRELLLTNFEASNVAGAWKTVNDNVMGGRSKGGPSFSDGVLTFAGSTNTNGGGFSSIRTNDGEYDLSGTDGLLIRVRGDGRTYRAELRTDVTVRRWNVPFRAEFESEKGEWREVFLPFDAFTPSIMGRPLSDPPALDPNKVIAFGFMIYDKKDGPFKLQVDWVKAIRRGGESLVSKQGGTIVDQVLSDGRFKTLATALAEAELVGVLQSKGPFTVFAPTDKAFAKLPKGTVADLLKAENRDKLKAILTYHVTAGSIDLATALKSGEATTVQGEKVSIAFADGRVRVNESTILNADIKTDNGVIHVIDTVLLPPAPANDIPSVVKRAGSFKTLLAAGEAAGLTEALSGKGPFTVLAPTDEAFAALPDGTVENLLKKENRDQLKAILTYHVIPGKVSAGDALNAKQAETLGGMPVKFAIDDGSFKVNDATIRKTDIACDNGVIHVIDAVLLPPSAKMAENSDNTPNVDRVAPTKRIETAIRRGVPIFNHGNPAGCAEIYRDCLVALTKDESIDAKTRSALEQFIEHADRTESAFDRAWTYRAGLDRMYATLTRSAHRGH